MIDCSSFLKIQIVTWLLFLASVIVAQTESEILNTIEKDKVYLPDFSYAGYHSGEKDITIPTDRTVLNVTDYGVIPDDGLDDSKALIATLEKAKHIKGSVLIQLPAGRIILSDILYFERSHIVFNGEGVGENGTEIYCPRPMMYLDDPDGLAELREYLIDQNKIQKEKENNISLPFSQYAWSGGFLWTQIPGKRVKSYLTKYDTPPVVLGTISIATKDTKVFKVNKLNNLKVGDVVEIQWYNKQGKNASLLEELYGDHGVYIGSHHWNYPDLAIVRQQVKLEKVEGDQVTIASPLSMNVTPEYKVQIVEWEHLEEVGLQNFKITFPLSNRIAHHVEQGYNGIYLTRVYNSWVKNVVIDNADSGILTENIANVSIEDIVTTGKKIAHYSVQIGGVHNVLVRNLSVYNHVTHPISFNTFATRSIYTDCEIFTHPILDQHSGVNHQNLFDNIKVHVAADAESPYPLFAGGGAKYWKPSHGYYNTFWNINVHFTDLPNEENTILLYGMRDGPGARLFGVHGNTKLSVEYEPSAYINFTNRSMEGIPSLYQYQLRNRLNNQ
jgi:hypothetical protein